MILLSSVDQCVSTALLGPTLPRLPLLGTTLPEPALLGLEPPRLALPGLEPPRPALPGLEPPRPVLPGLELPRPALPGLEPPRPVLPRPALGGVELGQSSSNGFSFAASQPTKALVVDQKQNETGRTSGGTIFSWSVIHRDLITKCCSFFRNATASHFKS